MLRRKLNSIYRALSLLSERSSILTVLWLLQIGWSYPTSQTETPGVLDIRPAGEPSGEAASREADPSPSGREANVSPSESEERTG
jgi:hypothetical protein